jgi:hypothetical protein
MNTILLMTLSFIAGVALSNIVVGWVKNLTKKNTPKR